MKRIKWMLFLITLFLAIGALIYIKNKPQTQQTGVVLPTVIELKGIGKNKDLTGRATRAFAVKGTSAAFLHIVRANLPDPAKPEIQYFAWMAKKDKSHFIKTGRLNKGEKGEWKMDFRDTRDYADYPIVLVTAETKDDGAPELILLEGSF